MFKKITSVGVVFAFFALVSTFAQSSAGRTQGGEKIYQILAEDNFYSEFMALKAEVDELKVLISDLKNEISHKQSELTYLQDAVIKTSRGLNDLNQQKMIAQEEVKKASQSLSSLNSQKTALQQEIERSSQVLSNLTHERESMQLEVSKTSRQLTELNAQKSRLLAETAQLRGETPSIPAAAVMQDRGEPTLPVGLLKTLYFSPDSTTLVASLRLTLDEIGAKMLVDPDMRINVRGYAAPAGTRTGQMRISELRAKKTAEYLRTNFGIAADRIEVEWVGAQQQPSSASPVGLAKYRAVEVFAI